MITTVLNPTVNETYAALPDKRCNVFTLSNTTGVDLEIRRVAEPGNTFTLKDGVGVDIYADNVSEWECKRVSGTGNVTLEILADS
jgi:hypothetical protein